MAWHAEPNTSTASTTWVPKVDKVRGTPAGRASRPAKPVRFGGLARRNMREPLTLKIRYKGGAEAWWLIEARGRTVAFPGHMCVHDMMREVCQQWTGDEHGPRA